MSENGLPKLEGFDFEYAMNIFQDEEILKTILVDFYESLDELCEKLNELLDSLLKGDDFALYRMEVHALKSSSASVGALEISRQALELERAAIEKNLEEIKHKHPVLIADIKKHKERLATIISEEAEKEPADDNVKSYFEMLKIYLSSYDMDAVDVLREEIQKYRFQDKIEPLADKLNHQLHRLETDEAIKTINEILLLW